MILNRTVAAILLILGTMAGGFEAHAAGKSNTNGATSLIEFKIKDQFGTVHRADDVAASVVLLIGGDKDGSVYNAQWGEAINEAVREHPNYEQLARLPHADLRGVPFFVKGMVKSKMPEDPKQWVLMDWKGALPKAYQFVAGSTNVLVFAPDGRLHHQSAGKELEEGALQAIVRALHEMLNTL